MLCIARVKIRNIEATEEAKQKLLRESQSKKDSGIVDFVPTNMAVNFMQHNRCKKQSLTLGYKNLSLSLA